MIVTCPSCGVRYLVDARALGTKGRMVRCARCHNSWHEDAPPPSADPPAAAEAPPPPPVESPPRDRAPALTAEQRMQLPVVPKRKSSWGANAAWGVAVLALVAGLGYAAVVDRQRVIAILPASAAIYATLGLPAGDAASGLQVLNLKMRKETENGLPALVIDGEVKNVSASPRTVPKLIVTLRDLGEHDLQNVTVPAPVDHLLPGESAPFHTSITQPADATSGVFVTFAGDGRS